MTWIVRTGDSSPSRKSITPPVDDVKPNSNDLECAINRHGLSQQQQQQQQHNFNRTHTWDIRDRVLPQVAGESCDPYDRWPDGNCKRIYDAQSSAEASRHSSGWAMRNTNNHNAAILKKSCLGLLVCNRKCVDVMPKEGVEEEMVRLRPAICDKARRKQTGTSCPTPGCTGVLELRRCHGHGGYPVTHFWRTQGDFVYFLAKGFHDHPAPESWKSPTSHHGRRKSNDLKNRKRKATTTNELLSADEARNVNKKVKLELPETAPVASDCVMMTSPWIEHATADTTTVPSAGWLYGQDFPCTTNNTQLQWHQSPLERCSASTLSTSSSDETSFYVDCSPPNYCYHGNGSFSDHVPGCRRRLFDMTSTRQVTPSYPVKTSSLFPSPPPSTADYYSPLSAATIDDHYFLPHLRACAEPVTKIEPDEFIPTGGSTFPVYSSMRMSMAFPDRQSSWKEDICHQSVQRGGYDLEDVLSVMANMAGSESEYRMK